MSKVLVEESSLTGIATAIRSKNGTSNIYKPGQMAQAIRDIPTGGSAVLESLSVNANGTYTPGTGVDGYNLVTVDVQPNLQSKTATENGTVTPDAGYDGLNSVVVNVSGGGDRNIFGTDIPTADIGNDGDYYYQYVTDGNMMRDIRNDQSSNVAIYGNEFIPLVDMTVTALRGRTNESRTGKLRIGNLSTVLATIDNVTFPAGTWVEMPLSTPMLLQKGTHYIVQVVVESVSSNAKIGYTKTVPSIPGCFSWKQARYGTSYPGSTETSNYVNADIVFELTNRIVEKQYKKSSGTWNNLI